MGKNITGDGSLGYLGVQSPTPPNLTYELRDPVAADNGGYVIGHIWITRNPVALAAKIWVLICKGVNTAGYRASWVQLYPTAGAGTVTNVAGTLPIAVNPVGAGAALYTVSLPNGANGQVLIGGGVAATWANITPDNGIFITNAANSITIETDIDFVGTGGGIANMVAGVLNIAGAGTNVVTAAGNTITITGGGGGGGQVNTVVAGNNINVNAVDPINPVVNLNKSIQQPITNVAGTEGIYALGNTALPGGYATDRFLHNYGAFGAYNTFLGRQAGNLTLTTASAINNTGLGGYSLQSLTTGDNNCSAGVLSMNLATSAANNSAYGSLSLRNLVSGNFNLSLGYLSGSLYLGAESDNILLMNHGVIGDNNTTRIGTNGNQTSAYFAGIYGVTPPAIKSVVLIDDNDELGSVSPLPIALGGTNNDLTISPMTQWGVNYYDGTRIVATGTGAVGQVLKSQGGGLLPPIWDTAGGTGTVTNLVAGTNISITGATPTINPTVNVTNDVTLSGFLHADAITSTNAFVVTVGPTTLSYLNHFGILQTNATGVVSSSVPGVAGTVLTSAGPLAAPVWSAVGGGTVTAVSATAPIFASMASPTPNISFHAEAFGKVLIANNTTSPVWSNLTEGSGITITNGSGSITITNKVTYQTDDGAGLLVSPSAGGIVKILGGAAIKTHRTAADTITIDDTLTINAQVASYILALTDAGKFITMNVVGANTVTIPLAPGVNWVIGTQIVIQQLGAGQTSIVAAGGVTIRSAGGRLKLTEQYSMAALVYIALNTWSLGGDVSL